MPTRRLSHRPTRSAVLSALWAFVNAGFFGWWLWHTPGAPPMAWACPCLFAMIGLGLLAQMPDAGSPMPDAHR